MLSFDLKKGKQKKLKRKTVKPVKKTKIALKKESQKSKYFFNNLRKTIKTSKF